MEHTAHVEQQLVVDDGGGGVAEVEEALTRVVQMQEQLRKAPQNTIREGNELLRTLEQVGVYINHFDRAKSILTYQRL